MRKERIVGGTPLTFNRQSAIDLFPRFFALCYLPVIFNEDEDNEQYATALLVDNFFGPTGSVAPMDAATQDWAWYWVGNEESAPVPGQPDLRWDGQAVLLMGAGAIYKIRLNRFEVTASLFGFFTPTANTFLSKRQ